MPSFLVQHDDRLSDVVLRHDALFGAAGSLSVHAGALTVVYTGGGPEQLLQLLTGSGGGGGVLHTLRLSARSLRFEAVPAKDGGGDGEGDDAARGGGGAAPGRAQHVLPAVTHACSGSELRDFINGSPWAQVWQVKLQRALLRDQEMLVLTRQKPREPASPSPAAQLAAAAVPSTR